MKTIYIVTYNISYRYEKGEHRTCSGVFGAYTDRSVAELVMIQAQYKIRDNAATYISEHIATAHINAVSSEVKIVETKLI